MPYIIDGITADTINAGVYYLNGIPFGGVCESVTYNQLVNLILSNQLICSSFYLINNFRTCYDQPDYDIYGNSVSGTYKQSEIEPIIVVATSSNTLSPDAFQPKYPNDKIKYDWTWNATENTSSPAFGRITERIDEWNNRTDYDHRTILFKRYKSYFHNFTNPLAGTITTNGDTPIDGGYEIDVIGVDTDFESELNVGDVIYVNKFWYKVSEIISATDMKVTGVNVPGFGGDKYYKANSQTEGALSQIPYTHTQMTDPPVIYDEEASPSDFIMDGAVESGINYFCGSNGTAQYFTNLYPGLFVMAAKNIEIEFFRIDGNIGADGGGDADISNYTTNINGNDYTAYIKRVYNSGDPSINHIFIVNGDGTGIVQNFDAGTDDDYHEITNLNDSGINELHYLLVSKGNSDRLEISEFEALVDAYLGLVEGADINTTLTTLNSSYSTLTALVPNIYLFNDVAGTSNGDENGIDDGGDDMYDGANFVYTNFSVKYRSYEWKNNNIIDDVYRELKTFRSEEELEMNGDVTSTNNWIGDYSRFYIENNLSNSGFLLANNVFGFYSYSNKLGDRCYNNATYNWFVRNQISGTFQNNSLKRGFYSNVVGEYFTNNVFYGTTYRNKFGEDFYDNIIGTYDVQNNVINNNFNNNYIALYDDFFNNKIGNNFNDNRIWVEFFGNQIGNDFNENNIYNFFYDNIVGENFNNNTIGDDENIGGNDFYNNQIGNLFKGNGCLGDFYDNKIGNDFVANSTDYSFFKNVIGDNFFVNNISNNFGYNKIGNDCQNNTIDNDFGFGGSQSRGNIIGNNFSSNQIGEYFYDNIICDNFTSNIINNYFQYNNVAYPISVNFSTATHVYGDYNCRIIRGDNNAYYLEYFNGTSLQYTSVNA